jgi:hypothetical protein
MITRYSYPTRTRVGENKWQTKLGNHFLGMMWSILLKMLESCPEILEIFSV